MDDPRRLDPAQSAPLVATPEDYRIGKRRAICCGCAQTTETHPGLAFLILSPHLAFDSHSCGCYGTPDSRRIP